MDNFIELVVIGIIIIVVILIAVLVVITLREKAQKNEGKKKEKVDDELEEKKAQKSIFKFMEFDTIEDNMIVQDGGKRYLMVIECKGVNYDLLSGVERNSIEQGFIAFLNTLKFEIQFYVQTRKVNLMQSTMKYRERLKTYEMDMHEEEHRYEEMLRIGGSTKDEILRELKEVTKKRNLYEYARDVIENTEQMSEDSDLTTKEYYIVVPYYTDEITSAGDYDKREISSMAFSELYTRAQALVSALNECDVRGRILNSQQLIELLFISYNREQHDTYDFEEYISQSGFDSFYSVTEDVLKRRIQALDEDIARKASDKAVEAYRRVNKLHEEMRKAAEDRERNIEEYIDQTADAIIDTQRDVMGKYKAEETKREIRVMNEERKARIAKKKAQEAEKLKAKNESEELKIESDGEEKKKTKRVLTPEEKLRRARILKKRKLLQEREAKKNGEN
ncbi:MAG: cell envelope integrity protein TolA [Clostridia bacterium]|nr:cell envelope integrity protein TolA [Clostridia bacterium]